MADPTPSPPSAPAPAKPAAAGATAPGATAANGAANYKAATPNPVWRMMGLPNLPKRLPSRNWMIFLALVTSVSGAIIYDKREKKRATARWARAVSHLGNEYIKDPQQLPRKLCVFLESPPTDGLRVAQDHYAEFVKPILAASGLDWEFVQGRKEGDVRAAVAERIRRTRRAAESPEKTLVEGDEPTKDEVTQEMRRLHKIPEWTGMNGDIVVGRHTWKEYIRGLHEGWLGPLTAPPPPVVETLEQAPKPETSSDTAEGTATDEKKAEEMEPEKKPDEKPARPPQPVPYNTTDDYQSSSLPTLIPSEFSPAATIQFPHILGFSATFIRLNRFFNRRKLADDIGREVAAVCLATAREYRESASTVESEQQSELEHEETDWPKSVWKEEEPKKEGDKKEKQPEVPAEKIWTKPIVLDPRISMRMRKFEILPEEEARAKQIVVPEEELEGWIKRNLRALYRWTVYGSTPHDYRSEDWN